MVQDISYEAVVEFDDEAEMFHGDVINIRDVITFQGDNLKDLKQDIKSTYVDFACVVEISNYPIISQFFIGDLGVVK